jgi:hypothetical protein
MRTLRARWILAIRVAFAARAQIGGLILSGADWLIIKSSLDSLEKQLNNRLTKTV